MEGGRLIFCKATDKNLLVVGGTGFIGEWVVRGGLDRNYKVAVLSRTLPEASNRIEGVTYCQADLNNQIEVAQSLSEIEITHVVNLGGNINHAVFRKDGRNMIDTHFVGTLNIVENLDWSRLKCFVQIGSSDEYGDTYSPQNEMNVEKPISCYSMGKLAAGQFLQMLYRTEKFPAIILRLFLVYGPKQNEQRFLPQVISSCLQNKKFPVSLGKQLRDFCYVEDIVSGIFSALESEAVYGEVFNLASGNPISIQSMVERVVVLTRGGQPEYGVIPYRKGECMNLHADISKANEMLKWSPITSLEEGLKKTISYYRK